MPPSVKGVSGSQDEASEDIGVRKKSQATRSALEPEPGPNTETQRTAGERSEVGGLAETSAGWVVSTLRPMAMASDWARFGSTARFGSALVEVEVVWLLVMGDVDMPRFSWSVRCRAVSRARRLATFLGEFR